MCAYANTIVNPWTVVVVFSNTAFTDPAVFTPQRLPHETTGTKMSGVEFSSHN